VLSRVLGTIREQGLFEAGERVLVAVSGGPDSTALLAALVKLAPRLGVSLAAAAVDHGLRPEAAREAETVRRRCHAMGIVCEVASVDVGQARQRHMSVQEAARTVRLASLAQTAARLGCGKIALGHTADDQAETVLFRILRGTGIAGLAGIPYRRGPIVRPLLDVRRLQILTFLARRKLDYLRDPSNLDRHYARVRIRKDVLPLLERENPRVVEALLSLARAARGEPGRAWLQLLPEGLYLPRRTLEVVDRLVRAGHGTRRVAVAGGAVVVRYGEVAWAPRSPLPAASPAGALAATRTIAGPGEYPVAAGPVVRISTPCEGSWPPGNAACFDLGKVRWPLVLRTWRRGDRMIPRGGRGRRKLSDLLIDAKIPREERAGLPVLCDASGTILFVPGLRPSDAGRPGAGTRRWFEVRLAR
jgi:tRNA(Ile)-lysidine synthase